MTGTAEMTVSPCSCMIKRKTPWVLGCCGPRLSVISVSPTSSTTPEGSMVSKMVSPSSAPRLGARPGISVSAMVIFFSSDASGSVRLVDELLDGDVVVVHFVIASHGEADEVVGQQDAAQVWVAEEANAHHFEGFALHELGAGPDAGERCDAGHGVTREVAAQD